jgi:hypothetical protein
MANGIKYQAHELLNKVLNAGEDALKVDIDNVTLTTEGGDVAIDVALDKANDSVTIYANTAADGTGTSTVPLVDAAGNLQIDIVSSALPSGGATAANQATVIGHVDGVETLLGTIDADTSTLAAAVDTQMQVDVVASLPAGDNNIGNVDIASSVGLTVDLGSNNDIKIASGQVESGAFASGALASGSVVDGAMVTLGAKADAKSTATDGTAITAMQVLKQVSASAQEIATDTGTIDSDTDAINTATVASQAALEKMLYGNALAVTAVDGGTTHALGATYEALYVGVGGNVVVTMVGTGNFTFSNVASGQLLPIRITHVINTNTTATNMIALKA